MEIGAEIDYTFLLDRHPNERQLLNIAATQINGNDLGKVSIKDNGDEGRRRLVVSYEGGLRVKYLLEGLLVSGAGTATPEKGEAGLLKAKRVIQEAVLKTKETGILPARRCLGGYVLNR